MVVRNKVAGIDSPEALAHALSSAFYLADDGLATAAFLALALGKPLLLEGAPGVGKTEAAKALSGVLGRRLIRLQCYEGIDATTNSRHCSSSSCPISPFRSRSAAPCRPASARW
jgi:hypothetical protein